jgi:RNA polymerase sigma-70 factor, ECF subfamily
MSAAWTSRDDALFERLVRSHRDCLYRFAYHMTGNREEAEDLTQQGLLEAYVAFDQFQPGTHFARWMYRIMRHSSLDSVRRRARVPIESLDRGWEMEEGKAIARDVADTRDGPEAELLRETLSEPLERALDALPSKLRSVVLLAGMKEMSYEEVARALGCPVGTVRSRLHRARNLLRRALHLEGDGVRFSPQRYDDRQTASILTPRQVDAVAERMEEDEHGVLGSAGLCLKLEIEPGERISRKTLPWADSAAGSAE